jgi:hypothetical protein
MPTLAPAAPPTVLRLKRARSEAAPALLSVQDGGSAKRARTADGGAFGELSLSENAPALRRATFRRVDAAAPGVRGVIEKARVVDVAAKLLKRKGGSRAEAGRTAGGAGRILLCNGVEMVRERLGGGVMVSDGEAAQDEGGTDVREAENCGENFVYDVYVREDRDALAVVGAAAGLEDVAVLLACDVPEVEFWSGDDNLDSSGAEAGDAYLEDSEGSVDYPSTPDSGAYAGEVVAADESDASHGEDGEDEDAWRRREVFGGRSLGFAVGNARFGGIALQGQHGDNGGFFDGSSGEIGGDDDGGSGASNDDDDDDGGSGASNDDDDDDDV